MSVAHDLNRIDEEKRKEAARALIVALEPTLQGLRSRVSEFSTGDLGIWRETRVFAQEAIRAATPLELHLLVACAKEVLYFTEVKFSTGSIYPRVATHMSSALDTVAMELMRLKTARELQ